MALPAGFNPMKMDFGNTKPVITIPRNFNVESMSFDSISSGSDSSSFRRRSSLWSRFNNGVASLGNWFADHTDSVLGIILLIYIAGVVLTGLGYVIAAWINEGFWIALITAIICCIVGSIAYFIGMFVVLIAVNVFMYAFRFIFWNGWTLLIAVILSISSWIFAANSGPNYTYSEPTATETPVNNPRTYTCTAVTLNVRSQPNKYSRVLGTLRKGQEVEVISTENGFAEIEYNGQKGYASLKYLNKTEE